MSRQPRGTGLPVPTSRQNEYFVSRDGIDREVISADICRYLGNDALVRPGHYEDPQTGQIVQGYYITAYRNLTSAMIEDLKADSARWDTERRTQSSRNTSGGSFASRDAYGYSARISSNSPVVQYRTSETHHSRQHHGPTEGPYNHDSYGRDSASYGEPRYPGTGTAGYTGAAGGYSSQSQYSNTNGASYTHQHPPPQQSPQPDPRYANNYNQPPPMDRGYSANQDGPPPYVYTGANNRGYPDNYANSGRMSTTAAAPTQPIYATAAPPQQPYPAPTSPFNYAGQVPTSGASYAAMHAPDAAYGRASPAGQANQPQSSGFPSQGQQFGEAPPNPRASVAPPSTSTTGAAKRRSDRDDDRHTPSDRHSRQPRR